MRIVDNEHGLYISDTFVIQLRGKVLLINKVPLEFDNEETAKSVFTTLVDKLQQIEDGQEDSVVIDITDNAILAYGIVVEKTPANVKLNGVPVYTGYKDANTLFEEIKEQLLQQKIDNSLNPAIAPIVLKKAGFISDSGSSNGGGIQTGNWCPNKNLYICQADDKPKANTNPPAVGAVWIDTKDIDIYMCVDNTQDKNIWKSIKGDIVKPLPNPIKVLENITKATNVDIGETLNDGMTLVYYGYGWQSGNYHYFFRSFDNNGNWKNDAYYGNGFTVRQNCGFDYEYIDTPPSGDKKLVAIFRFDSNGYLIRFYEVGSDNKVSQAYEHSSSGIKFCSGTEQICVYADGCNGESTLGGEIYRFELYDQSIKTDDFDAIAQRIVDTYNSEQSQS